jgi:tetratricopeptide (TPR) repeat protein
VFYQQEPLKFIEKFELGVQLNPHPIAWYILATAYINTKQYKKARMALNEVLELQPGYWPARETLHRLDGRIGNEKTHQSEPMQEFFRKWEEMTEPGTWPGSRALHTRNIVIRPTYQYAFGFGSNYGDINIETVVATHRRFSGKINQPPLKRVVYVVPKILQLVDEIGLSVVMSIAPGVHDLTSHANITVPDRFKEWTALTIGPNKATKLLTKVWIQKYRCELHRGYHESQNYKDFCEGTNFAKRRDWLHAWFLPRVDMDENNQISVVYRPPLK